LCLNLHLHLSLSLSLSLSLYNEFLMTSSYIQFLEKRLRGDLPGWEAQKIMTSIGYAENRQAKENSKSAAVLALLFPNQDDKLQLIYIKRPSHNSNDRHGGQVSFPGGQRELSDRNLEHTALRETEEELGIDQNKIKVLGALSSIYVFVSDFDVLPFVGYLDQTPSFAIQPSEVAYPIVTPVAHLLDKSNLGTKDIIARNYKIKNAPFFDLEGETLWGATAMITNELLYLIKEL